MCELNRLEEPFHNVCVYQITVVCTLNILLLCQLYVNKAEQKKSQSKQQNKGLNLTLFFNNQVFKEVNHSRVWH